MTESGERTPQAENRSSFDAVSSEEVERTNGHSGSIEGHGRETNENIHKEDDDAPRVLFDSDKQEEADSEGNKMFLDHGQRQQSEIETIEKEGKTENVKKKFAKKKRDATKQNKTGFGNQPAENAPQKMSTMLRKRRRATRVASIGQDQNRALPANLSQLPLPGNQYSTTLCRRAVRKLEEGSSRNLKDDSAQSHPCGEFGDVSLGMKLIVAGGKVIVQTLNDLDNGAASPAQLAGNIQRGDVLLAIGGLSLVNLPVDKLMQGLRPLSTPGPGGEYERMLSLRFEAGAGLDLLEIHEKGQTTSLSSQEPKDNVFSLFPMVDQLSGAPLFEIHIKSGEKLMESHEQGENYENDTEKIQVTGIANTSSKPLNQGGMMSIQDLDELISATLAKERMIDRSRYQSEYFDWQDDLSKLLKRTVSIVRDRDDGWMRLTQSQRLELGERILEMTKALEKSMEEIDKGRDLRSFKTWSTNFSLRSGVSARRRFILDSTSVRSSPGTDLDSSKDNDSIDSDGSGGSLDDVDADTLLLGLAARDEIWRKQVMDTLNTAISDMERFEQKINHKDDNVSQQQESLNINEALTEQLGNFLFGERMNKILKHEKRSVAFPPNEITRVLFDLTTNLAAKSPDEITLLGASTKLSSNLSSLCSATTPTDGKSRAAMRCDMLLANRFILDEALPKWLKTFCPIPPEQRRMLWPKLSHQDGTKSTFTGQLSDYPGHTSDGDTLTLDSGGSQTQGSIPSKKKGFRDLVEEQQIDSETKSETCFLVTYFYLHKIIDGGVNGEMTGATEMSFVEKFGAYLQIHTCLTYAANAKDESAIIHLLDAAKHDLTHLEAIKEITKSKDLVFYEPGKLSAVLVCLKNVQFDRKDERRDLIRDLCISAYPDVLPWQVRQACLDQAIEMNDSPIPCSKECLEDLYYSYLSHLLSPLDGNDAARHDAELVREYCEWSVGLQPRPNKRQDRLENFLNIASRSSIQHKRYIRDKMLLLKFAVIIGKDDLVLDLVDEILDSRMLLSNKEALHTVLSHLRKLGCDSLVQILNKATKSTGFWILGRVMNLLEKMGHSDSMVCRACIAPADELYILFQEWKIQSGSNGDDSKMYFLIDFVIDKSNCPEEVVRALLLWSTSNDCGELLLPRLRALLCKGVHFAGLKGELSGTLLRLRHARSTFTELVLSDNGTRSVVTDGTWEAMGAGTLAIDK